MTQQINQPMNTIPLRVNTMIDESSKRTYQFVTRSIIISINFHFENEDTISKLDKYSITHNCG